MPGTTAFPAALDAFPVIGPNTSESAPGVEHDVVHENVHAAVAAVEAKLGITGSTDPASIDARVGAVETGKLAVAEKGTANGVAPLGADAKLAATYLPAAVLGQVEYQGLWDASLGTSPSATPEKGWYYIVSVAGSTALDGIIEWKIGDWAIYNGTAWNKVDNTDAVASVAGLIGVITAAALKTALTLEQVDNTADAAKAVLSATKLTNSRSIDGQAFDGTANISVIAPGTHAAPNKTTPVDADEIPLVDSATSFGLARLSWANLKATLKTYFDTLYPASAAVPKTVSITTNPANSTTAYADVTGLSFPVVAGRTYRFKFFIAYTAAATTTGSAWAINGPALTVLRGNSHWSLTSTTQTTYTAISAYDFPASGNATSATLGTNTATLEGSIRCSASGNVIARFLSEVAASAITVSGQYSWVEYQQID